MRSVWKKKYSKNQILEFYLNNIYFGNGYYGVEAAARGYFDKSVSELTLAEQAFIAAIPNNPTRYNPLTNYDNTVQRKTSFYSSFTRRMILVRSTAIWLKQKRLS